MPPRSFSETGAMGAGSGAGNSMGTPATNTVNDGGGMRLPRADDAIDTAQTEPSIGGYLHANPSSRPRPGQINPDARPPMLGPQDTSGIGGWGMQFRQDTGGWANNVTSFAEGGAIPTEEEGDQMTMGPANGLAAMMAKAVGSAKEVLAYGRKKHGLGGGDDGDDGAIPGAQAGLTRMPTVPASQSESGVKPLQPAPGKLPPTNNPFGKRAEAEPDEGAIDTEEEMA